MHECACLFKILMVLDAVSEYERQLIVGRTTRGLHKSINEGRRTYKKLYGYERVSKDRNGHCVFELVETEINNYKYAFQRYMEGATLMKVCYEIYDMNKVEKRQLPNYAFNLGKLLRLYQYTGYQLTIEGSNIYKRFRRNEVENLKVLLDRKYWVKSIPYHYEIISIEDWVTICERLQIRGKKVNATRKERILRASKDIATGLIECGTCGKRYYYHEQRSKRNKDGDMSVYLSYFHIATINSNICKQRPRSFKLDDANEIFRIFYFYFLIVFDNHNDQIRESQRNIKHTQLKLKERINKYEKEISAIDKRILKFKKVLDDTDDVDVIKFLSKQVTENEENKDSFNIELSKLKIENELQNEKFNQTLLEMTYYDVKEKVNDWFFKLNVEEQRNELVRIIKKCSIYSHYMLIEAGSVVFFFDILSKWVFDMKLLEELNRDENFKEHFVRNTNKMKVRQFGNETILRMDLNKGDRRILVFQYLIEKMNISYDLSETHYFVSFVRMKGVLDNTPIDKLLNEKQS